jgi:hypothetical protein
VNLTHIESVRRSPVAAIVFLLVAIFCATLALTNARVAPAGWIGALIFGLAAGVRWGLGERAFYLELCEAAFQISPLHREVRYSEIRGIRAIADLAERGGEHYPLEILLDGQTLWIPALLTVPSWAVEEFFRGKISTAALPTDENLRAYLRRMIAEFGPERVWWANGTPASFGHGMNGRQVVTGVTLAAIAVLVMTLVVTFAPQWKPQAFAVGIVATLAGAVAILSGLLPNGSSAGSTIKNREQAAVIVTPLGVAVKQGDLQGEVRWDEIRDIKLIAKARGRVARSHDARHALVIKVAGATVRLVDIFDQSLEVMNDRIVAYWR